MEFDYKRNNEKYNMVLPPHGVVCEIPIKLIKPWKGNEKYLSRYRDNVNNILTPKQKENYKQQTNNTDFNKAFNFTS